MLTRVATIDLSRPLERLFIDWRYDQLLATFTWGPLPLGNVSLEAPPNRQISPRALRQSAADYLGWELLERSTAGTLEPAISDKPGISVVVCTRDRPLSLKRCLDALAGLDYPDYEVVVVDNGSKEPAVAQTIAAAGLPHIRETRQGLDWARNCGIRASKNPIVAFVDDDAIASRGWLLGIARGFSDPEVSVVTGLVLPAELETQAQLDFERYGGMGKGFRPFSIRREELSASERYWASSWGVGTNMAFRRSVFEAVGDFDVALDAGTPTRGAGDIEFLERVVSSGRMLRYEPMAFVRHVHRRDLSSLNRQIYDNGRSFASYLMTVSRRSPGERRNVARFALRDWIGGWLLRRIWRGVRYRDRETLRLASRELRGMLSAPIAYRRSRRMADRHRLEETSDESRLPQ